MIIVYILLGLLLGLFITVYISSDYFRQFGAKADGTRLERMKQSPRFKDGIFYNSQPTEMNWSFGQFLKVAREGFFGEQQRNPETELPVISLNRDNFVLNPVNPLRVTWLGHATALIEIEGYTFLTDPVWSNKVSFSSLYGPTRFHNVPLTIEELPKLDGVIISHDHYDHLDLHTIEQLNKLEVIFYVPLGVGAHLEKWGVPVERIKEADWYDQFSFDDGKLELIATPARHFSGRSFIYGTNPTLWVSWVFQGKQKRVYFSGDTGYFDKFTEIKEKYGPFDISLLAIGAYGKHWPLIHLYPEEAVLAHMELDGGLLIPIHWGTFNLAFHAWDEPAERLVNSADSAGIDYYIPKAGEMVTLHDTPTQKFWWRE